MSKSVIPVSYGMDMLNFIRSFQTLFQNGYTIFCSHQQLMSSCCSTSLLAFGIVSVLKFGQSNRCAMVSHCFDLHFSDDM